jgi:hypothetical protein
MASHRHLTSHLDYTDEPGIKRLKLTIKARQNSRGMLTPTESERNNEQKGKLQDANILEKFTKMCFF